MPIDSKHPDYCEVEKDYCQIADCIAGQRKIKKEGIKYLPMPNANDQSEANIERYKAYKKRALFHNMTAQTVNNMVGQCFAVDPVPTVPDQMDPWLEDIDGSGVSAIQQSKKALAYVTAYSRAGLWVDYPRTVGPVSVQQAEEDGIRPQVILVDPRDVINWRVTKQGAKAKLSLVVIRERYIKSDDGFEAEYDWQYRELRLKDNVYSQQIWQPVDGNLVVVDKVTPEDGFGKTFDYIPFVFIGAEANDSTVEKPLMLDISNVNIAHYRDSAEYQEVVFMSGQPTPWIAGLDDQWVSTHLPQGVMLGSRVAVLLPEGGSMGLTEIKGETLAKDAMDQKELLAQQLGAKLVEKSEVAKTATEAGINEASETSILAACCKNTSAAYAWAFTVCAQFAKIEVADPEKDILFELNTDFAIARMSPEEAQATMALQQGGLITMEEARDKLKTGGWAYLDDEEAKDQLEQQAEDDFQKAQQEMKAQTDETIRAQQAKPQPAGAV